MKYRKWNLPKHYAVISAEEMQTIDGGIGPTTLEDGKYSDYETAGSITVMLEDWFNRIFQPSYSDRQTINKTFAGIGVFQTIVNALNPTAIAKAINTAPVFTGIFDALGKIGMSRV